MFFFKWRFLAVLILLNVEAFGQIEWPKGVTGGLLHTGAVHFYAEPGKLEITLYRYSLNKNPSADRSLKAVLTGPDGAVLVDKVLSDPSPIALQRVDMSAVVEAEGVYTMLLSSNEDQYLSNQMIGFSTNVTRFMINSGAGHADSEREEAIILDGSRKPFSLFFQPKQAEFDVAVSKLGMENAIVQLLDPEGKLVQSLPVRDGKVTMTGLKNGNPGTWELRLPEQKASILVKGLNAKFDEKEKPLPVWSTSRESFFDLAGTHWLLSPRRVAKSAKNIGDGLIEFSVYNNSTEKMTLKLEVQSQSSAFSKLVLNRDELIVLPGKVMPVSVSYALNAAAGEAVHNFRVVARNTITGLQAYALGEIRTDPRGVDMTLPIHLRLFEHDQYQFASEPKYPRENQLYFDIENRPWTIGKSGLQTLIGNKWATVNLPVKGRVSYPSGTIGSDKEGFMYAVASIDHKSYLVRVNIQSLKVQMIGLPYGVGYYLETYMGGKVSGYPPVLAKYTLDVTKKQVGKWSKVHRLVLYFPEVKKGVLSIRDSVLVSENCVGMSAHSGIPNAVATDEDLVHVVWGETSPPEKKDPGVPTFTATYNRQRGVLSNPVFLAYSPPVNDVHNISSILVGYDGRRHVIVGAHGKPFQYLTARRGTDDWSVPQKISKLGQTYVGAVMDKLGQIHLACRVWQRWPEFPGKFEAALYYQRMNADGSWKEQVPIAIPPLPGYSIYYQRVMMDRKGGMYLSFSYWSTWSAYREAYRDAAETRNNGGHRMVIESSDGDVWNVLTQEKLENGILPRVSRR